MNAVVSGRVGPWTDEDYLALGETPQRVELFDGSLHVTPAPTPRHQLISAALARALQPGTKTANLHLLTAVNVRLRPGRILIPDLVIVGEVDFDNPVIEAPAVRLVCEIISPGNAATDQVLKMHYYATAGIPWYLLAEQKSGILRLHQLFSRNFVEHAVAEPGETLTLTEPVNVTIDPPTCNREPLPTRLEFRSEANVFVRGPRWRLPVDPAHRSPPGDGFPLTAGSSAPAPGAVVGRPVEPVRRP